MQVGDPRIGTGKTLRGWWAPGMGLIDPRCEGLGGVGCVVTSGGPRYWARLTGGGMVGAVMLGGREMRGDSRDVSPGALAGGGGICWGRNSGGRVCRRAWAGVTTGPSVVTSFGSRCRCALHPPVQAVITVMLYGYVPYNGKDPWPPSMDIPRTHLLTVSNSSLWEVTWGLVLTCRDRSRHTRGG